MYVGLRGNPDYVSGVVWKGEGPDLQLRDIVELLAPILWFSTDEPLITQYEDALLPHAHPCDPIQEDGVVYYQVRKIRLAGREEVLLPVEENPDFFEKVNSFTLRYFFYYREDIGLGSHFHDLELAEFEVFLEQTPDGCYQVRLQSVTGFAHGVDWYSNQLVVEEDTRYPLTLFVEEGKHASCPDRNADGLYTPGYDVNKRVNDAWGVRDILRTGYLMGSGFKTSMFKTREYDHRVLPPETPHDFVKTGNSSMERSAEHLGRYALRQADGISECEDMEPERERLIKMMRDHQFGSDYPPDQYNYDITNKLVEPLYGTNSLVPAISLRYDRTLGASFMLRGLDLGEGYLVPKINLNAYDVSLEALFTPSASSFFSWYLAGGIGYEKVRLRNDSGDLVRQDNATWNLVTEMGIKFRVRLKGKWRIACLGYQFAGLRAGIRNSGFRDLDSLRYIIEIGAGVW